MLARSTEGPFPPTVAWNTFLSAVVDHFKATSVPDAVTAATFPDMNSKSRSRILSSLRALKLIDDDGRSLPFFRTLVGSRGTGQWEVQLRVLMDTAYPYLSALNLAQADSETLRRAFFAHVKRDSENMGKCEAFYLNMARAAGTRLSEALKKRVATSDSMATIRAKQLGRTPIQPSGLGKEEVMKANTITPAKNEHRADQVWHLLDLLDDEDMTDKERAAVLTLLAYVKRKAAAAAQ